MSKVLELGAKLAPLALPFFGSAAAPIAAKWAAGLGAANALVGEKKAYDKYASSMQPYGNIGLRSYMNLEDLMRSTWKPVAEGQPIPSIERAKAYGMQQIGRTGEQAMRSARSIGAMTGVSGEGTARRINQDMMRALGAFSTDIGERERAARDYATAGMAEVFANIGAAGLGATEAAAKARLQGALGQHETLGTMLATYQVKDLYERLIKKLELSGMSREEAAQAASTVVPNASMQGQLQSQQPYTMLGQAFMNRFTPAGIPSLTSGLGLMAGIPRFGDAFRSRYGGAK